MPEQPKLSSRRQLYLLTFAHALVDTYATMLPHLLPLLLRKLASQSTSWSSLAGRLIAVSGIFNSLSQVIFGRLADRVQTIHFLTFGLALSAVCTSLMGVVPSLFLLMILLVIGGIGVASFHPKAVAQAGALAKQRRGFGISLFITGGNFGQAIGPFCIMLLLNHYGLSWLVLCMIPGLLVAVLVAKTLSPQPTAERVVPMLDKACSATLSVKKEKLWEVIRSQLQNLIVLYLITTLRTVTTAGIINFLSLYLANQQPEANLKRSAVLTLFTLAGSMGIMTGGWISDRISRHGVLLFSLIGAPPLLYASFYFLNTALDSTGTLSIILFSGFIILLFFGNFILASSNTVNIVLAQQLLPEHENLASSLMMGAAWGVAGLLIYPVGIIGDRVGLPNLLNALVMVPWGTSILAIFLKNSRK